MDPVPFHADFRISLSVSMNCPMMKLVQCHIKCPSLSLWKTVLYSGLSVSLLVRGWIPSRVFSQTGLGEEGSLLLEPMHNLHLFHCGHFVDEHLEQGQSGWRNGWLTSTEWVLFPLVVGTLLCWAIWYKCAHLESSSLTSLYLCLPKSLPIQPNSASLYGSV